MRRGGGGPGLKPKGNENQYTMVTIYIWYFLICRLVEKYVKAALFPHAIIGGSGS